MLVRREHRADPQQFNAALSEAFTFSCRLRSLLAAASAAVDLLT